MSNVVAKFLWLRRGCRKQKTRKMTELREANPPSAMRCAAAARSRCPGEAPGPPFACSPQSVGAEETTARTLDVYACASRVYLRHSRSRYRKKAIVRVRASVYLPPCRSASPLLCLPASLLSLQSNLPSCRILPVSVSAFCPAAGLPGGPAPINPPVRPVTEEELGRKLAPRPFMMFLVSPCPTTSPTALHVRSYAHE